MTTYYKEKNFDMIYWVEDGVVMCDDMDLEDAIESCYSLEEFDAVKNNPEYFEEIV